MNIEKYKYISFDIFDTLVVRNVSSPNLVFEIVEEKYNKKNSKKIKDFKENRILALKKAYQNNKDKEEILITDIYKELEYYYDKEVCRKLYNLELETEINLCVPNKKWISLYNRFLKHNKKLIITSDMYLEEKTIKEILNKCGIKDYIKLYLSSTYQKRKSSGSIFDYILKDLNIGKNDIVHIGDNLISDNLIPRIKGIKTVMVKNKNNLMFYNKKVSKEDSYKYGLLENFISNNVDFKKSYYYKMGYETFGPILYGFSKWLSDNIKTDKIFFLSRDGYLMRKAFNIVSDRDSSYFYASRRALIIPTLWMDNDLKSMLDKLYVRDYIKIGNLFKKLGLEEKTFKKIVKRNGFDLDYKIKYKELFCNEKFIKLFEEIKPLIHKNSKEEYKLLLEYMRQEEFNGNVSIVDIGWNGNMQMAFRNIINSQNQNTKIEGFYVGILPESKNIGRIKMNGYLFDANTHRDIYLCLKVINSIFESMFLASHGSVKKFQKLYRKIEPVLLDYEYDNGIEEKSYREIQEGALQFIRDFHNSSLKYILDIDANLSFYNMKKFAYQPKMRDVEKFGDFKFLEDDIIFLAKPKKLSYYLLHPRKLFSDVYLSGWLIGFMKRLTKINLFYTSMYKIYINIYLSKRQMKLGDE